MGQATTMKQTVTSDEARARWGCLHLRLSAGYHGNDPARDDQHSRPCWDARPDGPIRSCPEVSADHVPRHPGANADTLYSVAWLDLAKEPYLLNIRDAEGRYFMVPMLDGWTNVFQAPGTRMNGAKSQTYFMISIRASPRPQRVKIPRCSKKRSRFTSSSRRSGTRLCTLVSSPRETVPVD
jgi:hypothetical protein